MIFLKLKRIFLFDRSKFVNLLVVPVPACPIMFTVKFKNVLKIIHLIFATYNGTWSVILVY